MNFDKTKVIWIGKEKYSPNSIKTRWKKRILTPIGKITVIKTLLISTLNHLFISLPIPPQHFISSINKTLYTFIWNGPNRIKADILCKDFIDGGLKMVDVNAFIMSTKLKWIQRVLNNDNLQGLYNIYIDKCKLITVVQITF